MPSTTFNLLDDRAIISVAGEDSYKFLQGIISNDIHKVTPDTSIYALILNPQGKYLYDLFISFFNDQLLLEVNKVKLKEILAKLKLYQLRAKVTLTDQSDHYKIYSLPHQQTIEHHEKLYLDPRTIKMGARLITNADYIGSNSLDEKPYDYYRINNLVPEGDKDLLYEKSFPLEYGLDKLNAIDFNKGCYVGQEVTTRTKYRGVIRKAVYQVKAANNLIAGSEITSEDAKIGMITSVYENIGLALIRIENFQQANLPFMADQQLLEIIN